jgi:dihydrodipicolinate synthase/N-acetylneuraminate lyase
MLAGVKATRTVQLWSAAPTPLNDDLTVDVGSVERMVQAAIADVTGLFVAGTCGEGPWLPDRERRRLVRAVAQAAGGRLEIAVQVTDNSAPRILDNVQAVAEAGADFAVLSHPAAMMNATPERIAGLFADAVAASPLPVGIYDLGARRPFAIPEQQLREIYLLPTVRLVKDSSNSPERRALALATRREKPALRLFNGDEFRCVEYLDAGYDGCMFGGAAAVAPLMRQISELFLAGNLGQARAVDREMKTILHAIYGGETIPCWLTGLKYYMVRRGLFATAASFLEYPLSEECRGFVERFVADRELANA